MKAKSPRLKANAGRPRPGQTRNWPRISAESALPARPVGDQPSLSVSLIALIESWPEAVRQEIMQQNLMEAKIALPVETVEQSLRRGKVAFRTDIDRQRVLPVASPTEVKEEVQRTFEACGISPQLETTMLDKYNGSTRIRW